MTPETDAFLEMPASSSVKAIAARWFSNPSAKVPLRSMPFRIARPADMRSHHDDTPGKRAKKSPGAPLRFSGGSPRGQVFHLEQVPLIVHGVVHGLSVSNGDTELCSHGSRTSLILPRKPPLLREKRSKPVRAYTLRVRSIPARQCNNRRRDSVTVGQIGTGERKPTQPYRLPTCYIHGVALRVLDIRRKTNFEDMLGLV